MVTETTKTLGGRGARLLAALSVAGKTVFTVEDARRLMKDPARVRQLLYRLEKRGWVHRLERGKYLILPLAAGLEGDYTAHEFLIASTLVSPSAIAYGTALRYYGYSDRLSNTVYVATTRRKRSVTVHGLTYRFVTVSPSRFFGITQVPLIGPATTKAQCKKGGWKTFDNPSFKNQGQCVSYVEHHRSHGHGKHTLGQHDQRR